MVQAPRGMAQNSAAAASPSEADEVSTSTTASSGGGPEKARKKPTNTDYLEDVSNLVSRTWPLLLGNTLEWYEFGVYGYVEAEIAANFFGGSEVGGWMGFAVTFAARPLGGFLLGWVCDNWGRRLSVNLSLAGMLVGTVGQGLLPGAYLGGNLGSCGLIGLIVCRALQGLSAGGEIGAISCYLVEASPPATLGIAVSMISVGSQVAWALASGFLAWLSPAIGEEAMLVWGWRVPFIIALFPGLLALWGRNSMEEVEIETEENMPVEGKQASGIARVLRDFWLSLLICFCGCVAVAIMWYVPPFWTVSTLLKGNLEPGESLMAGFTAQMCGLAVTPLSGWVTDRLGVGFTTFFGATLFAMAALPVYCYVASNPSDLMVAYAGVAFFGVAQGISGATIYLFSAELFPASIRGQGLAASYNLAISFVGGSGSLITQAIYQASPSYGPGLFWSASGVVSAVSVLVALMLQRRGSVQLTHRRAAPYFRCMLASTSKE